MQTTLNQELNKLSREDLKKKMRRGDMQRVANASEVNLRTVYRWFNDDSNDEIIHKAVIAVIEKNEADLQERLKNI